MDINNIKVFLNREDIQDAINNNNFKYVWDKIDENIDAYEQNEFAILMLNLGINPYTPGVELNDYNTPPMDSLGSKESEEFYKQCLALALCGTNKLNQIHSVTLNHSNIEGNIPEQDNRLLNDPFEVVLEWDFSDMLDLNYIPELNQKNKNLLENKLNINENIARDLMQDRGNKSKFRENLILIYGKATNDAYRDGAAKEAHQDVIGALEDCFKNISTHTKYINNQLYIENIAEEWVMLFLDNDTQDVEGLNGLCQWILDERYKTPDPYMGYSDCFDDDTFQTNFALYLDEAIDEGLFDNLPSERMSEDD